MSSIRNPETFLRAYRPGQENEPLIEKAFRAVGEDSALKRRVEEQGAFDRQVGRAVLAIAPPEGLRARVCGEGDLAKKKRPPFAAAMYFTAFCSVAIVIALLVLSEMDRRARFPGRDSVTRIVTSANTMNVLDLEPVSNKAGDLGDWFFVRGFEPYVLPRGLGAAPAIGSRIFKQEGASIAQVAVDWHHALIYLFRADAFGVELPPGEWHEFQAENWRAALRKDGNQCTVVALQGDEKELGDLLHNQPPQVPQPSK